MVTIIVAAHGESAPALLKTAGMILGNFENVHPVTFLPGQGPEDLVEEYTRIVEASEAEETLLLVDLFGGSPYNAGAQFAATREGVDVVSGVNVPMLIEVISGAGRKNATLKSLVAKAHKAGTKGIRSFQDANQPAAAKPAEAKPAEAKAAEVPAAQQVPGGTMDAVFTRIDSRLIHGQVAGTWVPFITRQATQVPAVAGRAGGREDQRPGYRQGGPRVQQSQVHRHEDHVRRGIPRRRGATARRRRQDRRSERWWRHLQDRHGSAFGRSVRLRGTPGSLPRTH